jgi:Fe-S-cluster-containing dehydrogenase component
MFCAIVGHVATKKKNAPRLRTANRELERKLAKLYEARQKLAALDPGGSPERPLDVSSASVVQARAEAQHCLRCNLTLRCEEHTTFESPNGLLRVAKLECRGCGATRDFYLRIVGSFLN